MIRLGSVGWYLEVYDDARNVYDNARKCMIMLGSVG